MGQMTNNNAIDVIKESAFFTHKKYLWIRPLVEDVLRNECSEARVSEYIRQMFDLEVEKIAYQAPGNPNASASPLPSPLIAKKIKSIDYVTNVGLLNISDPIPLESGLNVFYGRNGAGKSSLYASICNSLGVKKVVYANLQNPITSLSCQTTVETIDGKDAKLTWNGQFGVEKAGLKVLDSDIYMHLVEKDQPNEFELSHLKAEYFALISEMLDKVGRVFTNISYEADRDAIKEAITTVFPKYALLPNLPTEKEVEDTEFTLLDETCLKEGMAEIVALSSSAPNAIVKNIEEASRSVDRIVKILGGITKSENESDPPIPFLRLSKSDLESMNRNMILLAQSRKSIKEMGTEKLKDLVPNDWISNPQWSEFVRASLAFVLTLDKESSDSYLTEKCLYCQQELRSESSKTLIKSYSDLQNSIQEDIDRLAGVISKSKSFLSELKIEVAEIPGLLSKLNKEIHQIGITSEFDFQSAQYQEIISKYENDLNGNKILDETQIDFQEAETFILKIIDARNKLNDLRRKLIEGISTREETVKAVFSKIKPYEIKQAMVQNRVLILKHIRLNAIHEILSSKTADLTAMKQLCSTLSTKFSKEVPLGIFKDFLKEEYKALKFTPPESWSIKSSTSGKENKRIYSLKDRRLSEIFSEGERKIHAFADFLAQCEMNKFKGIYIMDDPVNSLDEEKIESIKDRILRLVADGNQVLVFTHNLVFLNFLVDTSKQKVVHIDRLDNQIIVEPDSILGIDQGLARRKKTIEKRIKDADNSRDYQTDEFYLRNIYDLISGYIESYVEIKIFKDVINRYRPNIRMNSLVNLLDFNPAVLTPIIALYNQTSRKGSRHSQPMGSPPPTYRELKEHYTEWKNTMCK